MKQHQGHQVSTRRRKLFDVRRIAHSCKGQMLVIFSLALVALLGAVALCTDVGIFYLNWAQLQKCADSAVVAGAHYLPNDIAQAQQTTINYFKLNQKPGDVILTNPPQVLAGNLHVHVRIQRNVPHFFGRIFGYTSRPIVVEATGSINNVAAAGNVIPLYYQCLGQVGGPGCSFSYCVQGSVCPTSQLHLPLSAGFGELTLDGSNGSPSYRQFLSNGDPNTFHIGDQLQLLPGDRVGPTSQGIDDRLKRSGCQGDCQVNWSLVPGDSRVVMVPLLDDTLGSGFGTLRGFLVGWIIGVDHTSSAVNFQIIAENIPNSTPNTSAPLTGAFSVPSLIK